MADINKVLTNDSLTRNRDETMDDACELYRLIPKEKIEHIFKTSKTVGAECDYSFLGFEEVYKAITLFVPKSKIIIDFGCGYAFQSWYFRDYKKYIGVDIAVTEKDVLKTENSEFYYMSIKEFIRKYVKTDCYGFCDIRLPGMESINAENVFAICSYVPDVEARELVRETFPYCLVYYPYSR